jgi:DNA-directed RNA polymerase subunit RPC12/RpoP
MRKAKVKIVTVDATCPYCGGEIHDHATGSLYIDVVCYSKDQIFRCIDCGKECQLEAKAWR